MERTQAKAPGSIKILMVDDQRLVLIGLAKTISEMNPAYIVGTASSGEEGLEQVRKHRPNIVFMDVEMPGMDGIEATRRIKRIAPDTKVIALSVEEDYPMPRVMLEAGAIGYLSKSAQETEIREAIAMACNNNEYIGKNVAQKIALHTLNKWDRSPFAILSSREIQIARMVFNSLSVRTISEQLALSPKTVNSYRYRIFSKLNIRSDMQLALLAVKFGLLDIKQTKDLSCTQ